jgi:hypothetical protein
VAVACIVPICAYNHHFVFLWIGQARFGGRLLSAIAGANALCLAIFSLWSWCINGTGQAPIVVPLAVAQTVVNFGLSVMFTLKLGIVGPVLGSLVAYILVSSWYLPLLLGQLFGTSKRALFSAVAWPVLSGIPFAMVVWFMAHRSSSLGWLQMGSEMGMMALLYVSCWWWMGLRSNEKALWRERMRLMIPSVG